jgi:2-polyprenyl-6-methoxyphenol hydroxylase-like FAD-dependent oxidoreductase
MGGGIAGLALACQLKSNDPSFTIAVAEKATYPVPETAHKVGESTLPIAAQYFSEIIGLRDHLSESQVTKLGMRFFGTRDGNTDISHRPESGIRRPPPIPSYQLAHGRLENVLHEHALERGINVIEGARVSNVELGDSAHSVTLALADGSSSQVAGHWLIDASGRAAILKNKLGLAEPVPHRGQAAWFRIADRIAVDDWSDDAEWHSRVIGPERWRSTVHLHGRGYWVWLIALPSGVTSIGLVADPDLVPFDRMRRLEPLLDWMRENEPQLASEIEGRTDLIEDFQTRKEYPRGCSQVYSPERWFITGDAGIFLDPLYSPGLDFISVSNTFITGLIMDGRKGHPNISQRTAEADGLFRTFAVLAFGLYSNQYELFGNAEIISAKFTWETIVYFAFGAPLAFADAVIDDPASLAQKIGPEIGRYAILMPAFHALLRDWHTLAGDSKSVGMVSAIDEIMDGMQVRLVEASDSEDKVIELVRENLKIMESTFVELVEGVAGAFGLEPPAGDDWFVDDQALMAFRLTDLPKRSDGETVVPSGSGRGLCWSTPEDPDGAVNDHQSAWPELRGEQPFAKPQLVPNALETA